MISLRLSPAEYCQLRDACSHHGARSVSELARTAMQTLIAANGCGSALPVSQQLQEIRNRIAQLSLEIDRISRQMEPSV